MSINVISDSEFESSVIEQDKPSVVYFFAEWCQPCGQHSPIVESVSTSEDYSEKVSFNKIDIDTNTDTPSKYGVRGIPTTMLIKNGAVVASKVGLMTEAQLKAFIDSNI